MARVFTRLRKIDWLENRNADDERWTVVVTAVVEIAE